MWTNHLDLASGWPKSSTLWLDLKVALGLSRVGASLSNVCEIRVGRKRDGMFEETLLRVKVATCFGYLVVYHETLVET